MSFKLTIRFLLAAANYFIILYYVFLAINNPTENLDFIMRAIPFLCFSEFIITHASAYVSTMNLNKGKIPEEKWSKIMALVIYLFFIIFIAIVLNNFYASFFLLLGICGRLITFNGYDSFDYNWGENANAALNTALYLAMAACLPFLNFIEPLITRIIVMPYSVINSLGGPGNALLFQYMLIWGVLFYGGHMLLVIVNYIRLCFGQPMLFFSGKRYDMYAAKFIKNTTNF